MRLGPLLRRTEALDPVAKKLGMNRKHVDALTS